MRGRQEPETENHGVAGSIPPRAPINTSEINRLYPRLLTTKGHPYCRGHAWGHVSVDCRVRLVSATAMKRFRKIHSIDPELHVELGYRAMAVKTTDDEPVRGASRVTRRDAPTCPEVVS